MKNFSNLSKKNSLIILLIMGLSVFFIFKNTFENSKPSTEDTKPSILGASETIPWWNSDYRYSRSITINNTDETLTSNSWLNFEFDHKELVSQNIAMENGEDIQVVYKEENDNYSIVESFIDNPNTNESKIYFQLIETIPTTSTESRYSLYYGNNLVEESTKTYEMNPNNLPQNYNVKLGEEIKNPVFSAINRKWILTGTKNLQEYSTLVYEIELNSAVPINNQPQYAIEGTSIKGDLTNEKENRYKAEIDLSKAEPGEYYIVTNIVTNNGKKLSSPKSKIIISEPLFVVYSLDWEGYDSSDQTLKLIEEFTEKYQIPVTHFWNPRIYIAPEIANNRVEFLTDWIKNRASMGDEIGLHLHMNIDMLEAAGIEAKTSPNWDSDRYSGYRKGSDVPSYIYSYDEYRQLLEWSKEQFKTAGLKTPISFRAGGWMAGLEILKALQDTGFKIDSSGRTKFSLGQNKYKEPEVDASGNTLEINEAEELEQIEHLVEGRWNLASTTKPYKPSITDINSSKAPTLDLWEFPNNGQDSWRLGAEEMISLFKANYSGGILEEKQTLTYLSHPHAFQIDIQRVELLYQNIDQYNIKEDGGPVIFVTLEDVYKEYTSN
ncbi:hypothetical protein GF362_06280 [Candidatus Dojkabacteria bacterium]|nr:hypothetical protein [Candidatus Dojkabacteria bacterium]